MDKSLEEQLGEILSDFKIHNRDIDVCFNDALASRYVIQALLTLFTNLVEEEVSKAVIKELTNFSNPSCICNEKDTQACDDYWHHQNMIDDRIGELQSERQRKVKILGGE